MLAALPTTGHGQRLVRPERDWTTYRTPHFRFHTPREYAAWTREIAKRMESVRSAELATIGFVPGPVTDVVVDDPANDANGSAYPFLDGPAIFLWPVPPSPRSFIGNTRSWGEILAVHEFAHIAHLNRPSRNPWQRTWRRLIPAMVGPVATRSPRWAIEGYATYVEGALTGTGRPHGALRTAVLRSWALDGRLPTYEGMSGTGGYLGGSMAYLLGSAYLEWLGAERGDSSITALWRRLTARRNRSFDDAFTGVWGESPATLYGRFQARVTAAAFAAQARLDSAGRVEGALVQRLARGTGDPALSPDGRRLALVVSGGEGEPSRLVVWKAGPDAAADTAADSAWARDRRRLLRRDPEDVPAVRAFPLPRRPVATLTAVAGRTHHDPRWLPGTGRRLLVTRDEVTPDGVLRPDLFEWDVDGGRLRRVTRQAAVREADPAPDGRQAAAMRCAGGTCDLVLVDLATGAVRTLRSGGPRVTWTRPRWAPDGRRLVAAVQREGRWRPVLVDPAGPPTGDVEVPGADGAERYDATFTSDGAALVYVSEAGGIPNVVRRALAADGTLGDETPLTRVVSGAMAPEPARADAGLYFLHLTPHGMDLRRVRPDSTPVAGATVAVQTAPALLPREAGQALSSAIAQRPPVSAPTFAVGPVAEGGYGVGPRRFTLLPTSTIVPGGGNVGLQVGSTDPSGRLTVLLQGALPYERGWGGGALRAAWRGLPVTLTAEGFGLRQDLGADPGAGGGPVPVEVRARADYAGGTLVADVFRLGSAGGGRTRGPFAAATALDGGLALRVGGSAGRLRLDPSEPAISPLAAGEPDAVRGDRTLGFAQLDASLAGGRGLGRLALALRATGSTGRTFGEGWQRGVLAGRVLAGPRRSALVVDGLLGQVTGADGTAWEQFAVGGLEPGLVDDAVLSQRIDVPALPYATRVGSRVGVVRGALELAGGVTPYVQAVSAGPTLTSWARLVGAEVRAATPLIPFARAPGARLVLGVARILDAPLEDRTRGYVGISYLP